MQLKKLIFRSWYYFRQGWSTYFAFIFAAINTLVTTYYLAIKNLPSLTQIFPTFLMYAGIISAIGIPLLVALGYIHFKKSAAFSSEQSVTAESHPYNFKLTPGYNIEVVFPLYLTMTNYMIKWSRNQKLTDEEINEITELQKKLNILIQGGFVGNPKRNPTDI